MQSLVSIRPFLFESVILSIKNGTLYTYSQIDKLRN